MRLDPAHPLTALLVPPFALRHPGDFGIGDTVAVRQAVDFCAEVGISVLQLLPIHETVGDYSPYNPVSAFALSPALLSLAADDLPAPVDPERLEKAAPANWVAQLRQGPVKYNSVQPLKLHVLLASHRAFRRAFAPETPRAREFARFREENADWLSAYTLFRALVREYEGNADWTEWRPEHHSHSAAEAWLARAPERERIEEFREGLAYVQWTAARQWSAVRAHAEKRGVLLMGEMSFGVSRAGADVWAHPDLFDLEWNMGAASLGAFDTTRDAERWGQNWGFPPFRWNNHRCDGFRWLRRRIGMERPYFHLCRIDHLRGYFRAYMLPWPGGAIHTEFARLPVDEIKMRTGGRLPRYVPGPDHEAAATKLNALQGREIVAVLQDAAGEMGLVAELMGDMAPYMREVVEDLGMPTLSLTILDRGPDLALPSPDSLRPLSMATYATHDHAPLAVVYDTQIARARDGDATAREEVQRLLDFVEWNAAPPDFLDSPLLRAFQRRLLETPCALAAFLVSDALGTPQRFNLPGSYGPGTWADRLEFPLRDYFRHAVYGPRLAALRDEIEAAGRVMPQAPRRKAVPA
jgi:4-alpha-glucanotransferase